MGLPQTSERRSLADFIRPYRRDLAIGAFLLLLTNAFDKTIPWLLRFAVDGLRDRDLEIVRNAAVGVVALAAVMWIVRTRSRIRIFNIGRDVEFDLRNAMLRSIHRLGPTFFQRMSTGEVMSRATNDLGQVRLLIGFGLLNVVNSLFAYVGAVLLMGAISWKLTLIALAPYPLLALLTQGFGRALFVRSKEAQEVLAELSDRAQQNLSGIRVVRAFGIEEAERIAFEEVNERSIQRNMRLVLLRGLMWPAVMFVASLGTLLVVWRGGSMVLEETLTPGELAAFLAYLGQLVWPTLAFGYLLSVVQRGRASYARVQEILDAAPDVAAPKEGKPAGRAGRIDVDGVDFARGERAIVDDVSLHVPAGRSVAVVGPIGSGKSTVAAMLPRLLPPDAGTIRLDGDDVTTLDLASLRRCVGFVPQDPFLFSTTIGRNIAFGKGDDHVDLASLRAAAEEASVLEDIDALPEGFETVVGERGVQLSGGQKQRVALARAFLADPRVLVLDDPLSAVDAKTESRILEALDRAAAGRTLVLVTHRVAAAAHTDEIVVLDEGRVVERGTHDALVARGGLYAQMAARQEIERELEAL